jgi:TonB-dependent receptor
MRLKMKTKSNRFSLSQIALGVLSSLIALHASGQETNEQVVTSDTEVSDQVTNSALEDAAIEEVVVKASRLKGTASAVIAERKNQAFIADILGAEQISRTGDSDAAAALRRVTGLTLVDGKFIYVRGLGERYSSTQLNGAAVPSPDPTRTIIPLDLFPALIIESLSVQKSYSPSMPAHFGGGNVDIRLKTIPKDFIFSLAGNFGGNTDNIGEGIGYQGGGNDWRGKDDGTRAAPAALKQLWNNYTALNGISQEENRQIAADLNRDYDPVVDKVAPDFGLDATLGDNFTYNDFRLGYLAALSYDNQWQVSKQYEGQDFTNQGDGIWSLVRGFDKVYATEHSVKFSGMFNFGIEYNYNHRLDFSSLVLRDTRDEIKDKFGNTNNVLLSDGLRVRDTEVNYEERQMLANQVRGTHNFPSLWNIGLDWKYSNARSNRYAPGNISTRYILSDVNEDGLFDVGNESSLRKATTATRYSFQNLNDKVENYGFNLSLPLSFKQLEVELKAGADFVEKSRDALARRVDVNTLAFDALDLTGSQLNSILTDEVILNQPLRGNEQIIRDTSVAGDDYYSAQLVDAYYVEGDFFFNNRWRISGGVRWEDFRQVVAPLDPATGKFDLPLQPTTADLEKLAFAEQGFYPALALTYIPDTEMQYRFSYGETTVRPDIREVAPATYLDPLTGFPIGGTPSVTSTEVKNYDLRWEWYLNSGENLSVGLFYKDMIDPIEAVQSPSQDGPPLIRIANAEKGEVYGIEMEFLKDFNFIGQWAESFFLSGNVTLSDSEITIDTQKVVEQTGVSTTVTNPIRRMTGHSKYVVNLNLGYDAPNGNHSATLAYNVSGERIIIPGIDEKDDAYEQPFHSLDFIYTYYPTYSSTIKFKVKNLLDKEKEIIFEDTLLRSESRGVGVDLSLKWDF